MAETMIAVFVISMLTAVLYPFFLNTIHEGKVVKARNDMKTIGSSSLRYYIENGKWPSGMSDLVPAFLERELPDPWGHSYTLLTQDYVNDEGRTVKEFFVGTLSKKYASMSREGICSATSEVIWSKVENE